MTASQPARTSRATGASPRNGSSQGTGSRRPAGNRQAAGERAAGVPEAAGPSRASSAGLPHRAGLVLATQLPARLNALARLIQIASVRSAGGGFGPKLLRDATDLLGRAGERLRLSAEHTVVALAGGAGGGKAAPINRPPRAR